ncbi:hypothetical protein A9Q98_08360 [Thalassotalea sp. 42_200_T64]|nr:hypothetical protein A9Q98_08360 [Thalassotalea sp. 42_200_T64]
MSLALKNRRILRNHKRASASTKLSLISLMDIFTILVFFLMVNAADVQVMQNNKDIELPKSVSKEIAEDNLVVTITNKDVILQGRKIIDLASVKASDSDIIAALNSELEYQKSKRTSLSEDELENGLSINIMADKSVPYSLLKKIMKTASNASYSNISLAVEQVYRKQSSALAQNKDKVSSNREVAK